MEAKELVIRTAEEHDQHIFRAWAHREGWNPGIQDIEVFFSIDKSGLFIGEVENNPIGLLSSVKYGDTFGFIGYFIIAPEFRRQGYGKQLLEHALGHLENCPLIGVDSVPEQLSIYQRAGFRLSYANIRFAGKARGIEKMSARLRHYTKSDFERVAAFDKIFFPADRSRYLQAWLEQKGTTTLLCEQEGLLIGIIAVRSGAEGYRLGPFYAFNPTIAEELLQGALSQLMPGTRYFWDIPEPNAAAFSLVQKLGLQQVFSSARMYRGETPRVPLAKLYGGTNFEIG